MHIGWPQAIVLGIMLVIMLVSLGIDMQRHGEPKKGTENVFTTIFATCLMLGLLWWCGFFK